MIELVHGDCRQYMARLADKSIDHTIADPPYGEKIGMMSFTKDRFGGVLRGDYKGLADWDDLAMTSAEFLEIERVTRGSIALFGGNFFSFLPTSRGWYVWDKKDGGRFSTDYADCELIWTNQDQPARVIRHIWNGMIQENMTHKERRYHPTQKAVPVMIRLINDLTKPGDTVFDPYIGSGSTAVACVLTGRNCIGVEQNAHFYKIAQRRVKAAQAQLSFVVDGTHDKGNRDYTQAHFD